MGSSAAPVPGAAGLRAGPARLAGLGNHLVELRGRELSRQDFAVEMARLIGESLNVKAVAILGYESRRERLILLGEQGLSSEASAVLGGGSETGWDIPLRGLRTRRISVITAAQQNPFVPRPLIKLSPTSLSIASLPIFQDHEPVGALVLFAAGNNAFPDAILQTLGQALRVCARGLREPDGPAARVQRGRSEEESVDAAIAQLLGRDVPSAAAAPAADKAQDPHDGAPILHLVDPPTAPPGVPQELFDEMAAHVQRLEQRLAQTHEELERGAQATRALTTSRHSLVRERDVLVQQVADLEAAQEGVAAELRAQVSGLEERLLAVDSERARQQRLAEARQTAARESSARLESERDAFLARTLTAETGATVAQATLATERAERERLAAQVDALAGELRALQEAHERAHARSVEDRSAIEADRDGWKEQAATAGAQLSQRAAASATLDRELRGALVSRDTAASQLQAAREEIDRLAALAEELGQRATQMDAARAGAAVENAAFRQALADERTARAEAEQMLRADLAGAQAGVDRVSAEAALLRTEPAAHARLIAERDELRATLRQQENAARQAEATWQQDAAALRAEMATLGERLEHSTADRQQLTDERAALHTALAETRQRAAQADAAHATTRAELQTEVARLQRSVEALHADRTGLTERLDRALGDSTGLTRGVAEMQARSDELTELLRQRDAAFDTAASEREHQAAHVATLTGQLQAGQETLERAQARHAQDLAAIETDRTGWKEQAAAAWLEVKQRTEQLRELERNLRAALVARDTSTSKLRGARAEMERLSGLRGELEHATTDLDTLRATAAAENTSLRRALEESSASQQRTVQALRAELAAAQTDAARLSSDAAQLQAELTQRTELVTQRDQQLAELRGEIDALRQQSADRGELASHASALGSRLAGLEHQLQAARAEVAQAQQKQFAADEEVTTARRQLARDVAAAHAEQVTWQDTAQRLLEERDLLAEQAAAQRADLQAQRDAVTALESRLQEAGAGQVHTQEAALRLTALQQRAQELSTLLAQRDASLAQAAVARQELEAGVETLTAEVLSAQQELERTQAHAHAALESEREAWHTQTAAARAELLHAAAQLEAAQTSAAAERATLRKAFDVESAAYQQAVAALRTELQQAHAAAELVPAELAAVRAELAVTVTERDQQLSALHAEVARLEAEHEQRVAAHHQLRDAGEAMERQLALVLATRGEEEQALTHGLQAARDQIAQLEQERAGLRAELAETRQRVTQDDAQHAATLGQIRTEAADLRKQVKQLGTTRSEVAERLERAEHALATHRAQADAEGRRAAALAEQCAQLEQSLAAADAARAVLDRDLLQAHAEGEALRKQSTDRGALAQQTRALDGKVAELERGLAAARSDASKATRQRGALAAELEAARQQLALATAEAAHEHSSLRDTIQRLTDERAHVAAEIAAHAAVLEQERAARDRAAADADQAAGQLKGAEQRVRELSERLAQRAAGAQDSALEHQRLAAQLATLTDAVHAGRAALEAAQARSVTEQTTLAAERDGWKEQAATLRAQLEGRTENLTVLQRDLRGVVEARDASAGQLQEAQAELERLQALSTTLRRTVEEERTRHQQAEQEHQAAAQKEAQRLAAEVTTRRAELTKVSRLLAERDQQIAALAAEIEDLQQQSTDSGELAHQASELASTVSELERRLAESRGEAERAERQRAAAAEEIEANGRQHAAVLAAAQREQEAVQQTVQRLSEERDWLTKATAVQRAELQARATAVAELQAALERSVGERDAHLESLRREQEAAHQADANWQHTTASLRTEVAALSTRVAESSAACEQLRAQQAEAQRELESAVGQHGATEQALTYELHAARAQAAQGEHERAALQVAGAELRSRLDAAAATHQAALAPLQAEVADQGAQVTALTVTRAALQERLDRAEHSLVTQSGQRQSESQRAAALAERCAQLEQALAATEARRVTLDAEAVQARAEVESLRQHNADRGVLAHQAAELSAKVAALEQQVAAVRGEAARAEHQRAAAAQELENVRQQHTLTAASAQQEHTALRAALQELTDERSRRDAAQEAQRSELQAHQAGRAELHSALEQVRDERARLEQDGQDLTQRLAETQRRLEELSATIRQRDAALEEVNNERKRQDDALRLAEAALADLTIEGDELRHKADVGADRAEQERLGRVQEVTALRKEFARLENQERAARAHDTQARRSEERIDIDTDAPLVIERTAPLDAVVGAPGAEAPDITIPGPVPDTAVRREPAGELVLLDASPRGDEACAALSAAGFEVTRGALSDSTVDELCRRKVSCVMLNLAAGPSAWRSLRLLRERAGTRSVPILAYLMQPDGQKGFCFGRADFGIWPMEPERMAERLNRLRPKLKRLLAVSADVDGIGRLREPLARVGISTSVVLDGKQTQEFVAMVEPEAVIVHLSPDCPSSARAVAGLRADEATRNLPLLVLLDKTSAREETFFAATARELGLKATFQFTSLPSEIARLIG